MTVGRMIAFSAAQGLHSLLEYHEHSAVVTFKSETFNYLNRHPHPVGTDL